MRKTVFKPYQWLLCAVVLLISFLLYAYFSDETLKPEVQAVLNWQPPANYDVDNAYLTLLGIDAPANQDANTVGKQQLNDDIARFKQMMRTHKEALSKDPTSTVTSEKLNISDWKDIRCEYHTAINCVDYYLKLDQNKLNEIKNDYLVPINRYEVIKNSARFVEVAIPMGSATLPAYNLLAGASELKRIEAIVAITHHQADEGVAILVENAQFSRRLLKSTNSLIAHMVALSLIQRDTQVLSELLVKYPKLAQSYQTQLEPILATIEIPEYSIEKAFVNERNMMLPMIANLKYASAAEFFENPNAEETKQSASLKSQVLFKFYQGNATANLFYDLGTLRLRLAQAPATQFTSVKDEVAQKREHYFSDCINKTTIPLCFKNNTGKILALIAEPDYSSYIERHHDAEGYLRLVYLQLKILAEAPDANNRDQLLAQYPNPYTLKPMVDDGKNASLTFIGKFQKLNQTNSNVYQVSLKH
ncbi:MAG: hypothetical protein WBP13_07480 [Methylophilaceae bacterium]